MAATATTAAPEAAAPSRKRKPWVCTHCRDGLHPSCLRAARVNIPTKEGPDRQLWLCVCPEPSCSKALMCTECKHEGAPGEIEEATWRCADRYACLARVNAKRDSNPVYRQLMDIRTSVAQERRRKRLMDELARRDVDPGVDAAIEIMEDVLDEERKAEQKAKPKPPPRPKSGVCECGCKGTTKGGRFIPGHDAKLASRLVGALKGYDRTAAKAAWAELIERNWTKKVPSALRITWEEGRN